MAKEEESFSFPKDIDPYTQFLSQFPESGTNPPPKELLRLQLEQAKREQEFRQDILKEQASNQLNEAKKEASFQRWKEGFFIGVAVIAALCALGACWNIASNKNSSDDAKKAAIAAISSVLTSTMSGVGGYLAGKKSS